MEAPATDAMFTMAPPPKPAIWPGSGFPPSKPIVMKSPTLNPPVPLTCNILPPAAAGAVSFTWETGVSVDVGTGVLVAGTGVSVGVLVDVGTGVLVGVDVATDVLVGVLVGTGVLVGVDVATAVLVGVLVGTAVLVGVDVATAVLVGVLVGTGVLVAVAVAVFVGVGVTAPGQSFTVPAPMRTFTGVVLTLLFCELILVATVNVSNVEALASLAGRSTRCAWMQPLLLGAVLKTKKARKPDAVVVKGAGFGATGRVWQP
jgi:hypothetical protein